MKFMIVDDSRDDRTLAIREIRKSFPDAVFTEVDSAEAFEAALLGGGFDAVVTDYCMGWMNGLDVLRRTKVSYPDLPVLMVTGTGGEEVAVEAMKQGVDDYLLKGQLRFDRLPRAVAAALAAARHRRELARSERRYGELFHSVPVGLCRCTAGRPHRRRQRRSGGSPGFRRREHPRGTKPPSPVRDGWRAVAGGTFG